MKRYLYLLSIVLIMLLAGCSKKDQMVDFIPTPTVTPDDNEDPQDSTSEDSQGDTDTPTPTEEPVVVGHTETKYVKMEKYDAVLNVRATPSTDGEIVGFLVHTEKVEVIEIKDGWASFVMNGKICFVSADFLVEERPAYLNPPSPTPSPTNTPLPTPTKAPTSTKAPTPAATDSEVPPEI